MTERIKLYLKKKREFRKQKQGYFREKTVEIDQANLNMLCVVSLTTTVLVLIFCLITPYVISGWRMTGHYGAFLLTSASLLVLIALVRYFRRESHFYINVLCWSYLITTMGFMVLVDVFPYPEAPASFTSLFMAVVPVMFIVREVWVYGFLIAAEWIYVVLVMVYKAPGVGESDIFNSLVGMMFGLCLYRIVTKVRIEDNIMRFLFQDLSQTDSLTGILNRGACERQIRKYLYEQDNDMACALLVLDIDNFKQVNDSHGHQRGDEMLRRVADILKDLFLPDDIAGRLGGDEFIVFLKEAADETWLDERCRSIIERIKALSDEGVEVGCSVGVAMTTDKDIRFDELYAAADEALYTAKMTGKGRTVKQVCSRTQFAGDNRRKMLLVDDNAVDREIFAGHFRGEYDILEAESGEEAIALINQYSNRLSVILLDVIMPEMSGFEVLSYIRARTRFRGIPVIMISSDAENEEQALMLGANDMITKPIDPVIAKLRVKNVQEWKHG